MRRSATVTVTSVSTIMLGAGWAAGLIAAATYQAGEAGLDATSTAAGAATGPASSPATPSAAPSATADPSASATASASPTPTETTPAGVTGTFDGALVRTGEGDFQAQIVVTDGTISAVNVLVGGDSRRDSVRINERALPTLQERVLSAQTWNVEGISGASYTVQGFLASVADAMSQAGLA